MNQKFLKWNGKMTQEETSEEIIQMQIKLAYLEDYVQKLQQVLVEHTNTIEQLKNQNQKMEQKIIEMSSQMDGDIPNRKPPHY